MTATITYIAVEEEIDEHPCRYQIVLRDARGNPCHTAKGPDREHCLIGLRSFGFTIEEQ